MEKISLQRLVSLSTGFGGVLLLIGARAFGSSGSDLEWHRRPASLYPAACYAIAKTRSYLFRWFDSISLNRRDSGYVKLCDKLCLISALFEFYQFLCQFKTLKSLFKDSTQSQMA